MRIEMRQKHDLRIFAIDDLPYDLKASFTCEHIKKKRRKTGNSSDSAQYYISRLVTFFLIGSLLPTKFDFLLFSDVFSSCSVLFSLAATHPKYTPGSHPILAHTQRDVRAAAKSEADSRTLKSLAILDKNRVR